MSDHDSIVAQVTCMRERSRQLFMAALELYPANSAVIIRLQMINDQLINSALLKRRSYPRPCQGQMTVCSVFPSKDAVKRIARAIAKQLGVFTFGDEAPAIPWSPETSIVEKLPARDSLLARSQEASVS